jgi:hypothetical protein
MLLMMGGEMPETFWATHKRQEINLWNCCMLLVEIFELNGISKSVLGMGLFLTPTRTARCMNTTFRILTRIKIMFPYSLWYIAPLAETAFPNNTRISGFCEISKFLRRCWHRAAHSRIRKWITPSFEIGNVGRNKGTRVAYQKGVGTWLHLSRWNQIIRERCPNYNIILWLMLLPMSHWIWYDGHAL